HIANAIAHYIIYLLCTDQYRKAMVRVLIKILIYAYKADFKMMSRLITGKPFCKFLSGALVPISLLKHVFFIQQTTISEIKLLLGHAFCFDHLMLVLRIWLIKNLQLCST
ncbi:hypothetical protein ACJX0J_033723, partial [Zea mays]